MSVLFVGRDLILDREVVVKILNEEYSESEKRIEQFETEARLTAAVSHPNVVSLYTVGQMFGRFYLVMELIEGKSMEEMMSEKGSISEDVLLPATIQISEGLRAAKHAGLIHRDVKPGNILVDGKGTAKLLDFGLALSCRPRSGRF